MDITVEMELTGYNHMPCENCGLETRIDDLQIGPKKYVRWCSGCRHSISIGSGNNDKSNMKPYVKNCVKG